MNEIQHMSNMNEIQQLVEHAIDERAREDIVNILDRISLLKPPERLLLYMRMPSGAPDTDPLRQPQNPLGTRLEINHTINWVRSHLEHDPNVSIPKQDVYDDYFSYCNRIHIKPLSTADFGKVMKQVFPDIRPRRLGTRGNSRYCYAALRKTTRLTPPQLALDIRKHQPGIADQLSGSSATSFNSHNSVGEGTDQHAHIIRQWAAGVLDVEEFTTTKELAEYIATNQLITAGSGRSRATLPKGRCAVAKMKLPPPPLTTAAVSANTSQPDTQQLPTGAKRRRRKRRNSRASNSSPTENGPESNRSPVPTAAHAATGAAHDISPVDISLVKREPNTGHQQMAYNYSTNSSSCLDTNTESSINSKSIASHTYKTELLSDYETETTATVDADSPATPPMHVSDDDPIQPHPLCKKVRQAQQTKGLLTMRQFAVNNHAAQQQSRAAESLMRPPEYSPPSRLPAEQTSAVARRLALLQQYRASNGCDKDGEKTADDVSTDIIIPRERVISICNLDKDALDDYLNGGDNSQDQEVELMGYFQTTDEAAGSGTSNNISLELSSAASASAVSRQQVPVLENYHLSSEQPPSPAMSTTSTTASASPNISAKRIGCSEKNISELRWYLQQNLLDNATTAPMSPGGAAPKQPQRISEVATPTSVSNRHQIHVKRDTDEPACSSAGTEHSVDAQQYCSASSTPAPCNKFSQSLHATASMSSGYSSTQSPTTRRRNFTFVPISPGPESPGSVSTSAPPATTSTATSFFIGGGSVAGGAMQTQPLQHPFLSPQSALHRKHSQNLQNHHHHAKTTTTNPSTIPGGDYNNRHSSSSPSTSGVAVSSAYKPSISSTLSAPTSPSSLLVQQHQQQQHHHQHQLQQHLFQLRTESNAFHMPLELTSNDSTMAAFANRSQSAPLHRHMPANLKSTIDGGSGAGGSMHSTGGCTSLADTPVPNEFCDFSVSDLHVATATEDVLIKCEPLGVGGSSTDVDMKLLAAGDSGDIPDALAMHNHHHQHFTSRDLSLPSVSRSVPSTPQPSLLFGGPMSGGGGGIGGGGGVGTHFGAGSSMYADMSKSVPTTPTGLSRSNAMLLNTPFRYSPLELNRDFLINGNTVESSSSGKMFFDANQSDGHLHHLQQHSDGSGGSLLESKRSPHLVAADDDDDDQRQACLSTEIGDIGDELSSFGDAAADPIIGSDLLNNL